MDMITVMTKANLSDKTRFNREQYNKDLIINHIKTVFIQLLNFDYKKIKSIVKQVVRHSYSY